MADAAAESPSPKRRRRVDTAVLAGQLRVLSSSSSASSSASSSSSSASSAAADAAQLDWHPLNTQVGVLPQWDAVWAIRELLANALDEDRDGATADFFPAPASSSSSGHASAPAPTPASSSSTAPASSPDPASASTLVIRNRVLRAHAPGLTLSSFRYAVAAASGRKGANTSGQYGYGLKDAIMILAHKGVRYSASAAAGCFEAVVHPTTKMVYIAVGAPDATLDAHTVVTTLHNVREQDVEDAKRQLIRFREREGRVMCVHEDLAYGAIYRRITSAENEDDWKSVFLLGQRYQPIVKKPFHYVYDIYVDKEKLKGRDKMHLPPTWSNSVVRLVHSAPKAVLEALVDVWNPADKEAAWWETGRKEVTTELAAIAVQREEERRRAFAERQETEMRLERLRATEAANAAALARGHDNDSGGASSRTSSRVRQAQHTALIADRKKEERRLAELKEVPEPRTVVFVAPGTTAIDDPALRPIPIKASHASAVEREGVRPADRVLAERAAHLTDPRHAGILRDLRALFAAVALSWHVEFSTKLPPIESPEPALANSATRTLVLAPTPMTTPDALRHAAVRALASADLWGSDRSPLDRAIALLAQSLPSLPEAPAAPHLPAPRAPPAQLVGLPWCPLVVVPTWSDEAVAMRPLTLLLRGLLRAMQAGTDTVYVLALDDATHVPFGRIRFVHAIRRAGVVYADRTELDPGRVTTVIGLGGTTAVCAHTLTQSDAFRHTALWLVNVEELDPWWTRATADLDHWTGHPQELPAATAGVTAQRTLTWSSAADSSVRLPLLVRLPADPPAPVPQIGGVRDGIRRKGIVLLVHSCAPGLATAVHWVADLAAFVLGVPDASVRVVVVALGPNDAAVVKDVQTRLLKAHVDAVNPTWSVARVLDDADACVLGTEYIPLWTVAANAVARGLPTVVAATSRLPQHLGVAVVAAPLGSGAHVLRLRSTATALAIDMATVSDALTAALRDNTPVHEAARTALELQEPERVQRVLRSAAPSVELVQWTWTDIRYDVFISFHGSEPFPVGGPATALKTVRTELAEGLWKHLYAKEFSVFLDRPALAEAGKEHPGTTLDDLLQAILSTRGGGIAVVLLTPGFFKCKWPLLELACLAALHDASGGRLVHLLPICIGMTVEAVKAEAFVRAVCPALGKVPMAALPPDCETDATRAVDWVLGQVTDLLKARADVRGRQRPESFANLRIALADGIRRHPHELDALAVKLNVARSTSAHDLFDPLTTNNAVTEDKVAVLHGALHTLFATSTEKALQGLAPAVAHYERKWLAAWTKETRPRVFSERYQTALDWCARHLSTD